MKRLSAMFALAVALCVGGAFVAAPAVNADPTPKTNLSLKNLDVTGTQTTVPGNVTTPITGLLTITGVDKHAGTVSGTFQQTVNGLPVGNPAAFTADITSLVPVPPGQCQILDLVLGPLHLDLLGLVVDLDTVHLNITAQQGPGNLLGNLLCAVANLLNP